MRTIRIVGSLFLFFVLFSFYGCSSQSEAEQASQSTKRLLIPFYIYPDYHWDLLISLKQQNPSWEITAIVNQSNGDFTRIDTDYKDAISKLASADIRVIGYVYTQWGARDMDAIKSNIDTWASFYKQSGLSGMFFDEASTSSTDILYYKELTMYAAAKGLDFSVLNPGTKTSQEYIDQNVSSLIVVVEDAYEKLSNVTVVNVQNEVTRLAILVHTASTREANEAVEVFAATNGLEYIYVTPDSGSNPWDTLSPYY